MLRLAVPFGFCAAFKFQRVAQFCVQLCAFDFWAGLEGGVIKTNTFVVLISTVVQVQLYNPATQGGTECRFSQGNRLNGQWKSGGLGEPGADQATDYQKEDLFQARIPV